MGNHIQKYTAIKIINDIRKEVVLDPELVKELSSVPMIDYLREQITKNDVNYLKQYIKSSDNSLVQFAIALLQNVKDEPEIKNELINLWNNSTNYGEKMNVMFRILDYPDLDIKVHHSIFNFVINNWECWINECITWHADGDENKILEAMKIRLKDKRFPLTKAWVYLLMSTASPDKDGSRQLITKYKNKNIPNINKIIEKIKTD